MDMGHWRRAFATFLVAAGACAPLDPTFCASSAHCDLRAGGLCNAAPSGKHWCEYPDLACPSHYRWSEYSGDDLANVCVSQLDAGPDASPGTRDARTIDTPVG